MGKKAFSMIKRPVCADSVAMRKRSVLNAFWTVQLAARAAHYMAAPMRPKTNPSFGSPPVNLEVGQS